MKHTIKIPTAVDRREIGKDSVTITELFDHMKSKTEETRFKMSYEYIINYINSMTLFFKAIRDVEAYGVPFLYLFDKSVIKVINNTNIKCTKKQQKYLNNIIELMINEYTLIITKDPFGLESELLDIIINQLQFIDNCVTILTDQREVSV